MCVSTTPFHSVVSGRYTAVSDTESCTQISRRRWAKGLNLLNLGAEGGIPSWCLVLDLNEQCVDAALLREPAALTRINSASDVSKEQDKQGGCPIPYGMDSLW
jgi:hypothetical protein